MTSQSLQLKSSLGKTDTNKHNNEQTKKRSRRTNTETTIQTKMTNQHDKTRQDKTRQDKKERERKKKL